MSDLAPQPSLRSSILVVEDEQPICDLLSDILEADGFEPHCARTDQDAFAALRRVGAFACMIVDVNLGTGTTGYDVARFARGIDPQLPIIYVSGQTSKTEFDRYGVTGSLFVAKPFTPDELLHQLRKLVGDNDDQS